MAQRILTAALGAAIALGGASALAQQKQEKKVADAPKAGPNVALCIGCHGIPGYKTAFPTVYHVPMIAGQNPQYIVNALKAYKSGERSHPSMRGIALSLDEKEMAALAAYYSEPHK